MTQAVVQVRAVVDRSGFTNPLTLGVLISDASYLKVYADDELLGNGPDYSVLGIGDVNGVEITIIGADDPGNYVGYETFTALFDPPLDQQVDLSAGGILGQQNEIGLDNLNRRLQALADRVTRALKVPVNVDGEIETNAPIDGSTLVWDEVLQKYMHQPLIFVEGALDPSTSLGTSDIVAPTQNAVKVYVDASAAAVAAAAQPLDSDLTAIAALATTAYGRNLLELANEAALGVLLAATFQPLDSDLTAIAALSTTSFGRALLGLADAAALATAAGFGTGDSPQLAGLNLGNASDTTLSRGAAGFLAVEGKRVPSPASQASGDTLYRGGTEWQRLAKGTAFQAYRMDSSAAAPEWYTPEGTYTPTLTNGTNVGASTAAVCLYVRIGNFVMVWGQVDIDPTSGGNTTTILGISLPVASNLGAITDLSGVSSQQNQQRPGSIDADTANDRATLTFQANDTTNRTHTFSFGYRVI